jgi:hypothetical protein
MKFVVKFGYRAGAAGRIAAVGSNGLRAVGAREQAQICTSRDEASRALAMLSPHFAGVCFSVEPVAPDAQMECRE